LKGKYSQEEDSRYPNVCVGAQRKILTKLLGHFFESLDILKMIKVKTFNWEILVNLNCFTQKFGFFYCTSIIV